MPRFGMYRRTVYLSNMTQSILLLSLFIVSVFCSHHRLTAATEQELRDTWFDGAEITTYSLKQVRYGDEHPGVATLIFVTEPFDTTKQVKSDRRDSNDMDVLKLNALREFNTGIYAYRTMTSVFSPLFEEDGRALKLTTSVQDWCGQVYAQINREDGALRYELRSYFEGEGDQDLEWTGDIWMENGFWTLLRRDPQALPVGEFLAIPDSLSLRFSHRETRPYAAVGEMKSGRIWSSYRVEYPELGRFLEIEFATAFPHGIRGWTERDTATSQVTEAELMKRISNSYYWSQNSPKDRNLREKLNLSGIP